jgi:hypothetical protein
MLFVAFYNLTTFVVPQYEISFLRFQRDHLFFIIADQFFSRFTMLAIVLRLHKKNDVDTAAWPNSNSGKQLTCTGTLKV